MKALRVNSSTDSTLEEIVHPFDAVYDSSSRVLILGTMPSPASREVGFYYGHPRNRFWPVLAELFNEPVPDAAPEVRRAFALHHHIALWDVIAQCSIRGAADASIRDATPNDLSRILQAAPISAIFMNGSAAWTLYRRLCEPALGIEAIKLPSTSPANAAWDMGRLVEAYQVIKDTLDMATNGIYHGEAETAP